MSSTTTTPALKRKKRDAEDEVEDNAPRSLHTPYAHYQENPPKVSESGNFSTPVLPFTSSKLNYHH